MSTNLPSEKIDKYSDKGVRQFFDRYFTKSVQFTNNEIDSVVGFFKKRGFDENASLAVAVTLLQQAKLDKIPIYKLLDSLGGLNEVQLSVVVAEVLNYNRSKTSSLGFKRPPNYDKKEQRNIIP